MSLSLIASMIYPIEISKEPLPNSSPHQPKKFKIKKSHSIKPSKCIYAKSLIDREFVAYSIQSIDMYRQYHIEKRLSIES